MMLHSPRAAPMFRVLRTRFATSYAKLPNRSSLHRLFRCAPVLWLPTRSPRDEPMFLVLRTPFATCAWGGGKYVLATSSMPSGSTGFASPYKHTLCVFSYCLRLNKTRGFRFTTQAHQGCLHRSRTCRDDFLHIGAELAEMIL